MQCPIEKKTPSHVKNHLSAENHFGILHDTDWLMGIVIVAQAFITWLY